MGSGSGSGIGPGPGKGPESSSGDCVPVRLSAKSSEGAACVASSSPELSGDLIAGESEIAGAVVAIGLLPGTGAPATVPGIVPSATVILSASLRLPGQPRIRPCQCRQAAHGKSRRRVAAGSRVRNRLSKLSTSSRRHSQAAVELTAEDIGQVVHLAFQVAQVRQARLQSAGQICHFNPTRFNRP